MMTEEKRKELFAKKKYYREHPEEARKAYLKKVDSYIPVGIPPKVEPSMLNKKKN